MAKIEANVPKLRFPQFADAWEQRKLGEVFKFQNGFNGSKERYGTGIKLISVMDILNDGFITYESIHGKADVTEEEKERFSVDFGDVLFQRSSENVGDAGRTNVYLDRKRAVFGGFVIRGKKNSDYEPKFIRYVLDTKPVRKQITTKAQGAQHINVSQETLQNVTLCLPSQEEQAAIGNLFYEIDHLITLHQCECDALKKYKDGMLQKMFPKEGCDVPEIRFPGFTDAWDNCRCGDILKERNGQHPKSADFPLVSFTIEDGVTPKTDRYEREQLVSGDKKAKKYKETKLDDIVYNPANLKFGAIARNKYGNAVFSPIYVTFEVEKTTALPSFVELLVTRESFIKKALKYQQGTVYERMAVNSEDFINLDIKIPSMEEQKKIGEFFKNIDELINQQNCKVDALKKYKQGLLQQMFV